MCAVEGKHANCVLALAAHGADVDSRMVRFEHFVSGCAKYQVAQSSGEDSTTRLHRSCEVVVIYPFSYRRQARLSLSTSSRTGLRGCSLQSLPQARTAHLPPVPNGVTCRIRLRQTIPH